VWTSRLGDGRLDEIADRVAVRLTDSVYQDRASGIPMDSLWYPAVRISTDESVDELAQGLLSGDVTTEQIGRRRSFFGGYNPASQFVSLHLSSQGLICRLAADRSTGSARSFFWKVMRVVEFLRLKDQIYQDYAEFLRPEIVRLRSFRLSMKQKMLKEEALKLSVYDLTIPTYLLALDSYVRSLPPTWRYIYSLLSKRTHFSRRREQLKEVVGEWEAEVAQWEHGVVVLWKKVLSPLRGLLGL
jgi:hypothetical protein